jgi:hypothetical protein
VLLEDKVVDTQDAAHAERQQRETVLAHGEDQLPAPVLEVEATQAAHAAGREQRSQVLAAIHAILEHRSVSLTRLELPVLQTRALEALKTAADGKTPSRDVFVYASDRRDLLEQALAVLQPQLAQADDHASHDLREELAGLTDRVAALRHELTALEDSQDELLEPMQKRALEAGEPTDPPKPKPSPVDPDAPRPASTLTGPELAEPPRPGSALTGPELAEPPRPGSALTGPELPEPPRPASTLTGPALPDRAAAATTLGGDDLPVEPAPTSSLTGEPTDEASPQAKRPWWRRPFG